MTTPQSLAIVLTQTVVTAENKQAVTKRKFNNVVADATIEQIKQFQSIISTLTGEKYDAIEIIKTETIN